MEQSNAAAFAKRRKADRLQRRASEAAHGHETGQELTVLDEASTFGDLLDRLVLRKVHRLYLVDAEMRPIGVTTLTDVLYCIAGEQHPDQ